MGKYENTKKKKKQKQSQANKKVQTVTKQKPDYLGYLKNALWLALIGASFFLIELFGFFFLALDGGTVETDQLWPLAVGALWAVGLTAFLRLLPAKAARKCTPERWIWLWKWWIQS